MLYGRPERTWCGVPEHLWYDVGYLFFSGCGMVTSAVHMTPTFIVHDFVHAVWSPRAHMVWCPRASLVRCGIPLFLWVWYGHLSRAYDTLFTFHDFVHAVWWLRAHMVWCPRASVVRCETAVLWVWYGHLSRAYDTQVYISRLRACCMVTTSA